MKITMDGTVPLDQYEALRQEMLRYRRWIAHFGRTFAIPAFVRAVGSKNALALQNGVRAALDGKEVKRQYRRAVARKARKR